MILFILFSSIFILFIIGYFIINFYPINILKFCLIAVPIIFNVFFYQVLFLFFYIFLYFCILLLSDSCFISIQGILMIFMCILLIPVEFF